MNRRVMKAGRCDKCQLPHVGVRECYRDRLLEAMGLPSVNAREERTLRWLATVLDQQAAATLIGLIARSQENAISIALAASRGGAVTPSACTDGQAVTKGEAPQSGASPLEAASLKCEWCKESAATHAESWGYGHRLWCDRCVPMSGHYEYCPEPCRDLLRRLRAA